MRLQSTTPFLPLEEIHSKLNKMQQPLLLIDWLRQLHLNADNTLATKRWNLAEQLAENIGRKEAIQMMRVFLFPDSTAQHLQSLTELVLSHDREFPATGNTEEIRLLSGIVMLASIEKRPELAIAFALGIRAASFPKHRCNPPQRAIGDALAKFLDAKSNSLRPNDFGLASQRQVLLNALKTFGNESGPEDEPKNSRTSEHLEAALAKMFGEPLQRLSEESALLWWLLGAYSAQLNQDTSGMSSDSYALVAAWEAAERTQLLPPPPSLYPILNQVLVNCKGGRKRNPTLMDILGASDAAWRNRFVTAHPAQDCADLTPITTALIKLEDSEDITVVAKMLPKACPNVAPDLALPPVEAARQLFNEIIFLNALSRLN